MKKIKFKLIKANQEKQHSFKVVGGGALDGEGGVLFCK